jgi:hypothetical protein
VSNSVAGLSAKVFGSWFDPRVIKINTFTRASPRALRRRLGLGGRWDRERLIGGKAQSLAIRSPRALATGFDHTTIYQLEEDNDERVLRYRLGRRAPRHRHHRWPGPLLAKKRITETIDGFSELTELLTACGDIQEAPVPVAIETPRGLLVAAW